MVITRWIVAVSLTLLVLAPSSGADGCDWPLFGEINDEYLDDLYLQFHELWCCCYNNQVTDFYYWDDPESDGTQGSCSCSGWSASNCKTRRRYRFVVTESTVSEGEKNYHDTPGHWAGDHILTMSYRLRCYCYDSQSQQLGDCDISGALEVPLKYTKIYFCEDC
jgi:hypothetical protein